MITLGNFLYAQPGTKNWKGKKTAVVLTYDDALNVHLDKVIPLLDSVKLKGSFYLSGFFPGCRDRIADWRKAAARGHELGNHTLYHPCIGNEPGREWVKGERKMENYSLQRMREEVSMNNILLHSIDGKTTRTFAYPCGDTRINDSLYLNMNEFVAARGTQAQPTAIMKIDLAEVSCSSMSDKTGAQMIARVQEVMAEGGLLVFLFHGVGGEHSLNVTAEAHRQLIRFLKQHESEVWIAPMIEVAAYIKSYQATHSK